jgi:hypothetical protein
MPYKTKTCLDCGATFVPKNNRQDICNDCLAEENMEDEDD